jgi:hypothetical protein
MLKLVTLTTAIVLALPAVAGFEYIGGDTGWQLSQHQYEVVNGRLAMSERCEAMGAPQAPAVIAKARENRAVAGFEYVGGEAGWQLAQHKYEIMNGKLLMSDECDHAIRAAQAPTAEEIDAARRLSPGA